MGLVVSYVFIATDYSLNVDNMGIILPAEIVLACRVTTNALGG